MKLNPSVAIAWLGVIAATGRALAADVQVGAASWSLVSVPAATNFNGIAWYRAWVQVPDAYFAKHERNLFEESVGVNIRDLAGAHEVWVNGRKIGTGGAFPPNYRSGRELTHPKVFL